MKAVKGTYGYLEKQKKLMIRNTAVTFGLVAAVFLIGLLTQNTKMNGFTIFAVIWCLPASRFAVNLIALLPRKGIDAGRYKELSSRFPELRLVYEVAITSYERVMPFDCLVVDGGNIYGLIQDVDAEITASEIFIEETLKKSGHDVTVTIFKDYAKFKERLSLIEVEPQEPEIGNAEAEVMESAETTPETQEQELTKEERETRIIKTLLSISL